MTEKQDSHKISPILVSTLAGVMIEAGGIS